jgi:excinuclease ABC subunit A
MQLGTDVSHIISDPRKSILNGAIATLPEIHTGTILFKMLKAIGDLHHFDLDVPFSKLSAGQQRIIFYGTGERWLSLEKGSQIRFQYKGLYPALEEASRVSFVYRQRLADMQGEVACATCHGSRLRDDAGAVRFQGRTLQEVCEMPLGESLAFFKGLKLKAGKRKSPGTCYTSAWGDSRSWWMWDWNISHSPGRCRLFRAEKANAFASPVKSVAL